MILRTRRKNRLPNGGNLPILEIPVSAIAVPFISSALYVLGVGFMKMVFRALYLEARRTGKPIVYLFHPYEFAGEIKGAKDYGGPEQTVQFTDFRNFVKKSVTFTTGATNTSVTLFFIKLDRRFTGTGDDFEIVQNEQEFKPL